jgi:hypothetical protein
VLYDLSLRTQDVVGFTNLQMYLSWSLTDAATYTRRTADD